MNLNVNINRIGEILNKRDLHIKQKIFRLNKNVLSSNCLQRLSQCQTNCFLPFSLLKIFTFTFCLYLEIYYFNIPITHPFQVQLFDVGLFNNLDGAGYINNDDGVWSPESLCDVVQCPVSSELKDYQGGAGEYE